MAKQKLTQKELMDRINAFDERISRIEAMLSSGVRTNSLAGASARERFVDQNVEFTNPLSESKVFEHGLAWIGSSVLLLGMVFTMLYVNNVYGGITAFLLGIASAALTFFLAGILKKTLNYMAFMFTISAHLLIYYSLLRLHFFTGNPVIGNMWIVLVLLLAYISVLFYKADAVKSQLMGFIAYALLIVTALFADHTQVTLLLFVLATATVLYFLNKNDWDTLLILSIFMVYMGHTLWLIGNPLSGHPVGAVSTPQNNLVYLFLAWQSMVVLAIAIWFRSNLIVLMNTALYTVILLAYLITSPPITSYNISFTLIAIASARILNWQQKRLELKTGSIRNFYLVITYFAMLYTLYNAVPKDYITISWGLAAVAYMIMSAILRNVKYRWLAFLTLVAAVFNLFMYDISKMGVGYRIVAFIFVGLIRVCS